MEFLPELFNPGRFENYDYRYSDVFSFDLRDTISRRRAAKIGPLDTLSQLGFPGKTIASGDQVQSLYEAGEFEKISHYCDLDTLLTTAVFFDGRKLVVHFRMKVLESRLEVSQLLKLKHESSSSGQIFHGN